MKDAATEAFEALDRFKTGLLSGLYTGAIAIIESYDPTGKADILILPDMDLVVSVPIAAVQGGGFYIRAPYKKGDLVSVIFSYRSIDGAMHGETETSKRTHDINDAIIVGGVNPFTAPLPTADADKLVIGTTNGAGKITISPDGLITLSGRDRAESW